MSRFLILPVVCVSLLACGCSGGKKDWQPFSDARGEFSIEMPGKPKTQQSPVGQQTGTSFGVEFPNSAYLVSYVDLPAGTGYDYDNGVKGIADKLSGTVSVSKAVTLDGLTGQEYEMTIKKPSGSAVGRLFHVGNRLYVVQVLGSSIRLSDADVQRFLNSFKLTK
jgi:hypothetical protein